MRIQLKCFRCGKIIGSIPTIKEEQEGAYISGTSHGGTILCNDCTEKRRMSEIRPIDGTELMKVFLGHTRTEFEIKNKCMTDENVIAMIQNAPTLYPEISYKVNYDEQENEE